MTPRAGKPDVSGNGKGRSGGGSASPFALRQTRIA